MVELSRRVQDLILGLAYNAGYGCVIEGRVFAGRYLPLTGTYAAVRLTRQGADITTPSGRIWSPALVRKAALQDPREQSGVR
jgi:hypothetical protein